MDTADIVARYLDPTRPQDAARALKILKLLETPAQRDQVIAALSGSAREVVEQTLTPQVVQAHFARRGR